MLPMFQAVYGQSCRRGHSCLIGVLFLVVAFECRGSPVRLVLDTERLGAGEELNWCLQRNVHNSATIGYCQWQWHEDQVMLLDTDHPGSIRLAAHDLCLTFAQGIQNEPRLGRWAPCTGDSSQRFTILEQDTRRTTITMAGDEKADIMLVFWEFHEPFLQLNEVPA